MKTVKDTKENIAAYVAKAVCDFVADKPDASIAFAAGETFEDIFPLIADCKDADFSAVNAFNICEYEKLGADDEKSCAYELNAKLYSKLNIKKVHTPDFDAPESYDEEIKACGGLDLLVLGIGLNGHIGFNEPATLYDTLTHTQQLTDSTKKMKAEHFGGVENVPDFGVTMGLKTICSAKNVILVAFGEEKADIIHKLVYGKTSTYVPAAMLQMHMNMTLCLDNEAASKL